MSYYIWKYILFHINTYLLLKVLFWEFFGTRILLLIPVQIIGQNIVDVVIFIRPPTVVNGREIGRFGGDHGLEHIVQQHILIQKVINIIYGVIVIQVFRKRKLDLIDIG